MSDSGGSSADAHLPRRLGLVPAWGFVGRTAELADLLESCDRALLGLGPAGAVVAGEPGAGKTSLLAAAARAAHERGVDVLYGRAEEGLDVPFGAWRQAFERRWPDDVGDRGDLFSAVIEALAAHDRPLMLVLDDLQWADRDSLVLLSHVVSVRPSNRLVVVAAYRPNEAEPGSAIARTVVSVAREPDVAWIELAGLQPDDVVELMQRGKGASLDATERQRAERLCSDARGNPFFVTALLADPEEGHSAERRPARLRLLRDAIVHRLDRLGSGARQAATAAAVLGEGFGTDVVAEVAGLPVAEVVDVLERAVRDGLVVERDHDDGFDFAHALVAQALLGDLTTARRREMHRRAAGALDARGAPAAAVAHHLSLSQPGDAEGRVAAVEAAVAAGLSALEQLAHDDAVARLTEARAMVERWSLDAQHRCDVLLALGRALRRAALADQGRDTIIEALDLTLRLERWSDFVVAVHNHPFTPTTDPPGRLLRVLESALHHAPADEVAARTAALSLLSWQLHYTELERSRRLAEEAAVLADEIDDPIATSMARLAQLLTTMGDPEPPVSPGPGGEGIHVDVAPLVPYVALRRGDMSTFTESIRRERELAERTRRPDARWRALVWGATHAMIEGRLDDAEAMANEAATLPSGLGERPTQWVHGSQIVALSYLRGTLGDLADFVVSMASEFEHPAPRGIAIGALAAAGRLTEAREQLSAAVTAHFHEPLYDEIRVFAVALMADACQATGAAEEADVLHRWLRPYAGTTVVLSPSTAACLGAVDRTLGQLAMAAGRADEAAGHLASAARLDARMGARPMLALTRTEQAVLGVAGAAEEARVIAADLGLEGVIRRLDAAGLGQPPAEPARLAELCADGGGVWRVTYRDRTVRVRDVRGLTYLRLLVGRPFQPVHVLDLQGGVTSVEVRVLDDAAKSAYRRRLIELDAEIERAERRGDAARSERAVAEREALEAEIARAVGLGGRDRTLGSDAEKARLNVTRAIRLAIERVGEQHPELAAHLRQSVTTGLHCTYSPPGHDAPDWTTASA